MGAVRCTASAAVQPRIRRIEEGPPLKLDERAMTRHVCADKTDVKAPKSIPYECKGESTSMRTSMGSSMEIEITDPARKKIEQFLSAEGANGQPLRFAVQRTHCMGGRGYGYSIHVADERRADDVHLASHGLSLLVDQASARLLKQVQVDYVEGFEENGFRVTNSNAVGKCPCGHHDIFE